MTKDELAGKIRAHDLTYTYSDDGRCYSRGRDQWKEILQETKLLDEEGRAEMYRVWNEKVTHELVDWARPQFMDTLQRAVEQ